MPGGAPNPATPPSVPKIDDTPIPMSADDLAAWWGRVDQAVRARKDRETRWETLLRSYLPTTDPDTLNSNIHFRNTEQKKDTIFYRSPDLILTPLFPLQDVTIGPDGQQHTAEDIVSIKQAILKAKLGAGGVDLKWLANELLFDILQVSGCGPSYIAYECDKVPVPDPMTGEPVPVTIHEEWTWRKFSSKKLLIPHDWRSQRYDDAPWMGFQGVKPLALAKQEGLVPADFEPNATRDEHVFDTPQTGGVMREAGTGQLLEFVELWYRPAVIDGSVTHRQLQRRLVLVRGLETPAKHVKSPYQSLDPNSGRLTADSMEGYPIHVVTLRDMPDAAYVPSDAQMTDPLVRQMNRWVSQDIKMRDANIPKFLYDHRIKTALEILASGDEGDGAGVDASILAAGIDRVIAQLPRLEKAMSDIQGRAAIEQKINETLALGPNQSGTTNDKVLSATEISTAQATSNVRTSAEQDRFMSQILQGVRKYDSLLQRFATEQDYVSWVGRDGSKKLTMWDQTLIAGRYAYDIAPDSQLKIDAAQKRAQDLQYANLVSNAPETNRAEVLREAARDFGKDPSRMVQPPPPKQAEPPKVALSFTGADMSNPVVLDILTKLGVQVDPAAIQTMLQMTHGGMVAPGAGTGNVIGSQPTPGIGGAPPQTGPHHALEGTPGGLEPVNKHAGALTGNRDGRPVM
jgi:hypothetical protein